MIPRKVTGVCALPSVRMKLMVTPSRQVLDRSALDHSAEADCLLRYVPSPRQCRRACRNRRLGREAPTSREARRPVPRQSRRTPARVAGSSVSFAVERVGRGFGSPHRRKRPHQQRRGQGDRDRVGSATKGQGFMLPPFGASAPRSLLRPVQRGFALALPHQTSR